MCHFVCRAIPAVKPPNFSLNPNVPFPPAAESLKTAGKAVGGLVGAALGAVLTLKLKEKRQSAAIIELANTLVALGDPTALTRDTVAALEAKYGIVLAVDSLESLKSLYGSFVEAAIPPGDAPLSGNEAVLINKFKAALGLQDVDAAPVHMDVGRRFLRGRLEAGSRGEDVEARKVRMCSSVSNYDERWNKIAAHYSGTPTSRD